MHYAATRAVLFAVALLAVCLLVAPAVGLSSYGKQLTIYNGHVAHIHGPWGDSWNHDADGNVPMYAAHTKKLAYSGVGGNGKGYIDYNEQKMKDATPCGWDALIRHEKAHTKGFAHHEGHPPDGDGKREGGENPAFHPIVPIHCHYPATPDNNYANKY